MKKTDTCLPTIHYLSQITHTIEFAKIAYLVEIVKLQCQIMHRTQYGQPSALNILNLLP